jgi:hypothetical protein
MKYDFDEYVSRERKTDSLTVDGWREYLFSGQSEFAMRVSGRRANCNGSQSKSFGLAISAIFGSD